MGHPEPVCRQAGLFQDLCGAMNSILNHSLTDLPNFCSPSTSWPVHPSLSADRQATLGGELSNRFKLYQRVLLLVE